MRIEDGRFLSAARYEMETVNSRKNIQSKVEGKNYKSYNTNQVHTFSSIRQSEPRTTYKSENSSSESVNNSFVQNIVDIEVIKTSFFTFILQNVSRHSTLY